MQPNRRQSAPMPGPNPVGVRHVQCHIVVDVIDARFHLTMHHLI